MRVLATLVVVTTMTIITTMAIVITSWTTTTAAAAKDTTKDDGEKNIIKFAHELAEACPLQMISAFGTVPQSCDAERLRRVAHRAISEEEEKHNPWMKDARYKAHEAKDALVRESLVRHAMEYQQQPDCPYRTCPDGSCVVDVDTDCPHPRVWTPKVLLDFLRRVFQSLVRGSDDNFIHVCKKGPVPGQWTGTEIAKGSVVSSTTHTDRAVACASSASFLMRESIIRKATEYKNKKNEESIMVSYFPDEAVLEEKPKQVPRPVPAGGRTRCEPGFTFAMGWCYLVDVRNVPGTSCGNLDVLDASVEHGVDADIRHWVREFFWHQTKSCSTDIPFMVARGAIPKCVGVRHGFVEEFDCGAGPTRPVCRMKAEEMTCDSRDRRSDHWSDAYYVVKEPLPPKKMEWRDDSADLSDETKEWLRTLPKFDWRKLATKDPSFGAIFCSFHGTLDIEGACVCDAGWVGDECNDKKVEVQAPGDAAKKALEAEKKAGLFDRNPKSNSACIMPQPKINSKVSCDVGYVLYKNNCYLADVRTHFEGNWLLDDMLCFDLKRGKGRPVTSIDADLKVWLVKNFWPRLDSSLHLAVGPRGAIHDTKSELVYPLCFYPADVPAEKPAVPIPNCPDGEVCGTPREDVPPPPPPPICDEGFTLHNEFCFLSDLTRWTSSLIGAGSIHDDEMCRRAIVNRAGTRALFWASDVELEWARGVFKNHLRVLCETPAAYSIFVDDLYVPMCVYPAPRAPAAGYHWYDGNHVMPNGQIWLDSKAQSFGASARPPPCTGHGKLSENAKCICNEGWTGAHCDYHMPIPTNNHGLPRKDDEGRCKCLPQWCGDYCQYRVGSSVAEKYC